LSLMYYAFMCSGIETGSVESVCIICRMSPQHNTMPPEPPLLTPLRHVVHIGKSLKCSWSNWFIDLNGQMSNLVLIRTLRDSTDSDVRKLLGKLLTLECVRNKDRMAVEPIVRLTRPEVIEVLSKVSLMVHTLVPEKYIFWTSNQQGVCCHPVAICTGPLGSILALDYDFNTSCSRLLKISLHHPADVAGLQAERFERFMFQQRCSLYSRAR